MQKDAPDQPDTASDPAYYETGAPSLRRTCGLTGSFLHAGPQLRQIRRQNTIFIVLPIILGALAGFSVLKDLAPDWVAAVLALLASLFPALANALKIQTSVNEIAANAASYKSLQDRFRQLATIGILSNVDSADAQLRELMDRMDVARSTSITAPEKYFKRAQKKIAEGHYDFTVDAAANSIKVG